VKSEEMINSVMTANYDKNWKERAEQAREEKMAAGKKLNEQLKQK